MDSLQIAIYSTLATAAVFFLLQVLANSDFRPRESNLCKSLGSLHLAVLLMILLAILLGVTTFLESKHGTDFVVRTVYRARWFEMILIGIWVNIFFATVLRVPYTKKQAGFVLTHVGILLILNGSLVTRLTGIEGTITLLEGQSSDRLSFSETALNVLDEKDEKIIFNLSRIGARPPSAIVQSFSAQKNTKVELIDYYDHSEISYEYNEAIPGDAKEANPSLHFRLKSQMFSEEMWMSHENEDQPHSNHLQIGPATIELIKILDDTELHDFLKPREEKKNSVPSVRISTDNQVTWNTYEIDKWLNQAILLPGSTTTVTITQKFNSASVNEKGQIVENPSGMANPAITLQIENPGKERISTVRFAKFPDYQGAHDNSNPQPFITIEGMEATAKPSVLSFIMDKNMNFYYKATSKTGVRTGELQVNRLIHIGWADAVLNVDKLYKNTTISRTIKPAKILPNQRSTMPAAFARIHDGGKTSEITQVLYGSPAQIQLNGKTWFLNMGEHYLQLPFQVTLKDFRKVDYPNTSRAMEYESDVIVKNTDGSSGNPVETTISMNNVLDYRGWRFFQSSFQIDGDREWSTFQVAKDPGIDTIYLGSILMVLGIAILFWLQPAKGKEIA